MVIKTQPQVLQLGAGPQLLLDSFFVDSTAGLTRSMHAPCRHSQPVIPHTTDHFMHQPFFTVQGPRLEGNLRLPGEGFDADRFRYWGGVRIRLPHANGLVADEGVRHCYAESVDGLHWTSPDLGLVNIEGWDDNNLLPTRSVGATGYPACVIDNGPKHPDPDKRYMMISYKGIVDKTGTWALYSADGLSWTSEPTNPVIPYEWSYDNGPWSDGRQVYVDGVNVHYDEPRKRYVIIHVTVAQPEDGYVGKSRTGPIRRTLSQLESEDFIHWTKPREILAPPTKTDMTEYYSMSVIHRNGLYIGFPKILRDDLPSDPGGPIEGIGWTELAISRDGQNWQRLEGVFLDRGQVPYVWDHAMAWSIGPVYTESEMLFYYAGYNQGHKVGKRQIGLARSPHDRFVGLDTQADELGNLTSKPFKTDCRHITVNAAVCRSIKVQLHSVAGEVLPGYTFDQCSCIRGDSLAHRVGWSSGELPVQASKEGVVMKVMLDRASLYAINLEP